MGIDRQKIASLAPSFKPDGVVTAEQLLERAWDEHIDPFTNVLRVTVMTLRRKLGDPPVVHWSPGVRTRISGLRPLGR